MARIHVIIGLLSCRQVALRYSRGDYDNSPTYKRVIVKLHLLTCRLCDIYVRQIRFINEAFRRRWKIELDPLKVSALQKRLLNELQK